MQDARCKNTFSPPPVYCLLSTGYCLPPTAPTTRSVTSAIVRCGT